MAAQQIGSGLTEVAAVATLIGAPIAEALMHGLKAASGMAWAPTSTFGAIHVTKACLAASIPDWLRESCGLRNGYVDAAIGVMLPHREGHQARSRQDLGDAQALMVESVKKDEYSRVEEVLHDPIAFSEPPLASSSSSVASASAPARRRQPPLARRMSTSLEKGLESAIAKPSRALTALVHPRARTPPAKRPLPKTTCIYTLDRSTSLILDTVQRTERHDPIPIHSYHPDQDGVTRPWKDWLVILCSAIKIVESLTLWRLHAHVLWFVTLFGWAHAFVSAIILQTLRLGRDDNRRHTASDLIAGILPTPLHHGDNGKIVLGVPFNVRRSYVWRTLLGIGAVFNGVGIVGSFLYVGKQASHVVYVWIAFQVLFLISRPVVFYFVEGATARQGVIGFKSYAESDIGSRRRVMGLMTALASHQASIHPRGVGAYAHDTIRYEIIAAAFARADWRLTRALPRHRFVGRGRVPNVTIEAVVGDPVLRSFLWLAGSEVQNADVYDTCLVFLKVGGAGGSTAALGAGEKGGKADADGDEELHLAVPCVRVWSCNCMRVGGQRQRGNAHPPVCGKIQWFYWIPLVQRPLEGGPGDDGEGEGEGDEEEAAADAEVVGGDAVVEVHAVDAEDGDDIIQIDTPVERVTVFPDKSSDSRSPPAPTSPAASLTHPRAPPPADSPPSNRSSTLTTPRHTGDECWIYMHGYAPERVLTYEPWTDATLQKNLTLKEWNISLQKVEEVYAPLAVSRAASEVVREKLLLAVEGAQGMMG